MNFKRIIYFLILISLCSCSPPPTNEQIKIKVLGLLDNEEFDQAISFLRREDIAWPERNTYLAMALLGRGGFLPAKFSNQILDIQVDSNPQMSELISGCHPRSLNSFENIDLRCLVKRIFSNLPHFNSYDWKEAIKLLEKDYPNPKTTPKKYNLLLSSVFVLQVFGEMRDLILWYKKLDFEDIDEKVVKRMFIKVSFVAETALKGLVRARYSHSSISEFVTGLKKVRFIGYQIDMDFDYLLETGIPILIQLSKEVPRDLSGRLGRVLIVDAMDELIKLFQKDARLLKNDRI